MATSTTSEQHVLQLLATTMAPTDPARATSERELQQLLKTPASMSLLGPLLQQVVLLPDNNSQQAHVMQLDANLRLMAVLWLKQFLKLQWKASGEHMSDIERAQLKQVLLFAALHEPHATIALHLALILAQLARMEFPNQWRFEELFAPIVQALQSNVDQSVVASPAAASIQQQQQQLEQRSVDLLYRIVKELSTRRLMVHRKQFALLSVEVLPLLLQHWTALALQLSSHLDTRCQSSLATTTSAAALQVATSRLLLLLTLTKLLATMFQNAFRDLVTLQNGDVVRSALIQFYERLEHLVAFRLAALDAITASGRSVTADVIALLAAVDKVAHRVAAVVGALQKNYPIEFRAYLTPFLTLFWRVVASLGATESPIDAIEAPRRLQIEALQFFTNVLGCRLYKRESLTTTTAATTSDSYTSVVTKVITAAGDVLLTDAMVMEALNAVTTFFAASPADATTSNSHLNRVATLQQLVVMQFMRLSSRDLDDWTADPEAFAALSESLTATESVRACAENLFLTLLQHYPDETLPGLTHMTAAASACLVDIASGQVPVDDARVLDVDAVLLALGLGCYDLHSVFEFEPWFTANLVPILTSRNAATGIVGGRPVLRYRIVWLLSCWLAQLSTAIRPLLYDTLLSAVAVDAGDNADAALQLRVVQSLESVVSDWGFDADAFAPFLPRALACLFAFVPTLETAESKMKVLSCLDAILCVCPALAASLCEQISAPLPAMWIAESDASNLVRCKILQLLATLVRCTAEASSPATSSQSGVPALVEMCLQVVNFAADVNNPDEVFLMESGLELWREALGIAPSYSLALHALFPHVVRLMERDLEHVALVLPIIKQYIRLGGAQFWTTYHASVAALLENVLGSVKAEAGVQLARTLELIVVRIPADQLGAIAPVLAAISDACVQFAQRDANREPEMVVVAYLSVLARLLLHDFAFAAAHVLHSDRGAIVVELLLVKFFSVGSSSLNFVRRKVWALALCAVLPMLPDEHVDKTGQILELVTEVLDDERDVAATGSAATISTTENDDDSSSSDAGAYRAYRMHKNSEKTKQVSVEDMRVHETDLKALACAKLNELAARLGAARFDELLQTVDSSVLRKL